jgi:hypothetical protein
MREIEALVEHDGRWPGTDAERRAARHLQERLGELGRDAELEPTDIWPNWPLTHTIHALLAIGGSVLSVYLPFPALVILLFTAISAFGDLTGSFYIIRRLTGRRASQNVVSRERGDKPGTLILSAHYDAARTGMLFSRRFTERRAVLGKLVRRPIGPFEPFFWSIMGILVLTGLKLLGIEAIPLTVIQFLFTIVLILSVPLLVDVQLSQVVPGASDNASGVATVLRLAERYGGDLDALDVWVVLPGAEESLLLGMRSFVRKHKKELDASKTIFLNVDIVGNGTVRWMTKEGLVFAYPYHPTLVEFCDEIAQDVEEEEEEEEAEKEEEEDEGDDERDREKGGGKYGARPMVSRQATDALAARIAGFPAITITCRNALDYAPNYHQPSDVPENIDPEAMERAFGFCSELIETIDERIGPQLSGAGKGTDLSEDKGTAA